MSGFPNMSGKPDIDDALAAELEAAGIEIFRLAVLKNGRSEVDTEVRGGLYGWSFQRAWYYWRCDGPGIEAGAAERLHAKHGKDVRVGGHCGCPSPTEWYKGLAVGSYHVDTPEGLKALADTIKELVERKSPEAGFLAANPDGASPEVKAEGGRGEPVAWRGRLITDGQSEPAGWSYYNSKPSAHRRYEIEPLYTHPASPPDVEAIAGLITDNLELDWYGREAAERTRGKVTKTARAIAALLDGGRDDSAIRTGDQK